MKTRDPQITDPQIRNRIKVKRLFDLFDMGYREKEIMKITTENKNSS